MKNLSFRFTSILFLIAALGLCAIPVLVLPGCASARNEAATYNTIFSLQKDTTAAYDGYLEQVLSHRIPTNDVPKVTKAFDVFQQSMQIALAASRWNTNAPAPANLKEDADDLTRMISTIYWNYP